MNSRRTTLGVVVLLVVVATLQFLNAAVPDEPRKRTAFLDRLTPGEAVSLEEKEGRYEVTLFPKNIRPLSHTVVEVGQDYVVLRDIAGITDTVIPVYSIKSIKILRIGGK